MPCFYRVFSISQINSPCFYPFLPWFSGCPNHTLIKKNTVSFRGFAPCPPTRGFAPGPHWGQSPQTSYRQNKITVDYAIFILGQIKAWAQATRNPEVSGLQMQKIVWRPWPKRVQARVPAQSLKCPNKSWSVWLQSPECTKTHLRASTFSQEGCMN